MCKTDAGGWRGAVTGGPSGSRRGLSLAPGLPALSITHPSDPSTLTLGCCYTTPGVPAALPPVDAAGAFLPPGLHLSPITSRSLRWGSSGARRPLQHHPHLPALCVVLNNAKLSLFLAATGRAPAGCCSLRLPGHGREMPGQDPVGCSQCVFTVSGEAVNSPGLIESRCCGFALIRPPPPPPLDNVSLKPLCKLTAFLRAERWGHGHGHGGGSQAVGLLCCRWLCSLHSSCPGPGPGPGWEGVSIAVKRTDPFMTRVG